MRICYAAMHEPDTLQLERSPTVASLAPQGERLGSATDCRGPGGQRRRRQQGAEARQQTILFLDESGFYPLPSVVRTYAPRGQTPILREWWTRDHLSAISAVSLEGKLYFHSQDHAIDSAAVVAFLEHLLREVSGRMVII